MKRVTILWQAQVETGDGILIAASPKFDRKEAADQVVSGINARISKGLAPGWGNAFAAPVASH